MRPVLSFYSIFYIPTHLSTIDETNDIYFAHYFVLTFSGIIHVVDFVWLQVSRCAGRPRPWRQQQHQQHSPRQHVAYEPVKPSTEYDDASVSAAEDGRPLDQNLQEPSERDYGEPERSYAEPERPYADPEQTYAVNPERAYVEPERVYAEPEQNYEVDEAVSVLSDGRVHGVQQHQLVPTTAIPSPAVTAAITTTVAISSTDAVVVTDVPSSVNADSTTTETRKSGYVVDSKHYRKYRVEEETPDGFIVGEYGVVSHHDGTTRGVRYTADSSINPRVIYEALAKFLAL